MDERLQVTDPPRTVPAGVTAETPPAAIAWRLLRAEHQRRADESRVREAERRSLLEKLAVVAEEVFRLARAAGRTPSAPEEAAAHASQLETLAQRVAEALARAGVETVAPEGEPYEGGLMQLLDNIAQRPDTGARVPLVAEVITPAVVFRGELLRMGRAVITVPAGGAAEGDGQE